MSTEIIENFHSAEKQGDGDPQALTPVEAPKIFTIGRFHPSTDRLLLKLLPPPPEGLIVRPQIAEEQSERGYVIAVGNDVDVPVDVVAKFSKHSGPEEIHFDDEIEGDDFVLVYKHDIRGWFVLPAELDAPEPQEPGAGSILPQAVAEMRDAVN